jgi:hypothetical protein
VYPENRVILIAKNISYHTMKRHKVYLNSYGKVKEANLKRLLMVWFQLYGILEKAKL